MIWGYGSDKFLVNGLGSIFISLLMLEQMHTLLAVPSQKDRENRYIAMGVAVIGITVFMQFFWINEYSVWWNIPAQWVMLSIYGIIGEKYPSKRYFDRAGIYECVDCRYGTWMFYKYNASSSGNRT